MGLRQLFSYLIFIFRKALLLLRKKKYTEKIIDKTDNELLNIENLIMDIEFKKIEQNVLKGIQVGNETLKQLNAVFSIEQIESILEETEEGVLKQQVSNVDLQNITCFANVLLFSILRK